jgi:uncharacterized coiled-coil protein SlyX
VAEEKVQQIYPRIGQEVRQQLMDFCQEQGTTQGAVVEEALRRFLSGNVSEDRDRLLMERLLEFDIRLTKQTEGIMEMVASITEQQGTLEKIIPLLGAIISTLEEQTKEKAVAVVDWDELYKDDPLMQPGPPEGELLADLPRLDTMPQRPAPSPPTQAHWLLRLCGVRRIP